MATKNKAQRQSAESAIGPYVEGLREAPHEGAQEAESQATAHPAVEHRKTAPVAPKATSGNSQPVVVAIREQIAAGLYVKHPQAIAAAIEKIEAISTAKAHPAVASYKAEALDYLRGKDKVREAQS